MSELELLTIDETAAILGIGRSRCYAMAAEGTLPGVVRLIRSIRVSRRHLEAWIASSATTPDPLSRGMSSGRQP